MIPIDQLEKLEKSALIFVERRARAQGRLLQSSARHFCFAVVGLAGDLPAQSFPGLGEFRPVVEPPGEVELASALRNPALFGSIGRYAHQIRYELAIDDGFGGGDEQAVFNLAWWLISALRVRSLAEFLVPAVADRSWSVLSAFTDHSCNAQLLEDVPQVRGLAAPVRVTTSDIEWAFERVFDFAVLLERPQFRLAVDALTTHQHLLSERAMAASLWAGIEALFGIESELRFRLAVCAASYLEPRGEERIATYRRMKKLYDVRSKAVHGGTVSESILREHVVQTRHLLSRILLKAVELGAVPTESDLERVLLQ